MKFLKILFAGLFTASTAQAVHAAEPMDRHDTGLAIRNLVWAGFETQADIEVIISEEYLDPADLNATDRQWIRKETAGLFEEKRDEEKTWPKETDVDRLEAAFEQLGKVDIIALHNAGNTRSDGRSDAEDEYHARKEAGRSSRGWLFYHAQDVDGALSGGELHIAFGAFEDADNMAPVIAREAMAVLGQHGLKAEWDGDVGQRIRVAPFLWRKRSPAE
ncbi:hypothetical protein GAO09_28050 [Rhizobiales bacterium RZME27]|uniref:DUF6891 domain-containing protein n=1 Tax=Endobacterium cereale TaxID=2663029 RepID=A0A6A8AGC9_9HYPH|nr:hypothetical protein [Endobacterium cereale]MEB2842856.1 hypothetical protein [Endobacterium cereale]MQY49884.1 hypothetical protein [Endobacterium cereale]